MSLRRVCVRCVLLLGLGGAALVTLIVTSVIR